MKRDEALRRSTLGVAVIETDVGRGLGFVIDPAGYLITNRHVVEDADHIESVVFPAMQPPLVLQSAQIEYIDPVRDLALLRVHSPRPLSRLPMAASSDGPIERYAQATDGVTLLRSVGARLERRHGAIATVAAYNPAAGPGPFIGVDIDIERGQSGGPVLDRKGRAVGVVTWTWKHKIGAFAIPIDEAMEMLAERPRLESPSDNEHRAAVRSRAFLVALGRGALQDARRLTSPSHARAVRELAVDRILEGVATEGGAAVLQGFIAALETLVEAEDDAQRFAQLRGMVTRTGADPFRDALGLDRRVDAGQVISFFYEFGQAYLVARTIAGEVPGDALETAMQRLGTVDAARTFALADVLGELAGNEIEIEHVEVVPGAYNPRAVVSLRAQGVAESPEPLFRSYPVQVEPDRSAHLTLHMRREWGDWYVASVGPTPLGGGPVDDAP
jgi:hypothetical protein